MHLLMGMALQRGTCGYRRWCAIWRSTIRRSAWSRRKRCSSATSWKAGIAIGRTPAIVGKRSTPIFRHASTASASSPAITAACGTRRGRSWISPLLRPTTRRFGFDRCVWPLFWHRSERFINCGCGSWRNSSICVWKSASMSGRASRGTCTIRCCKVFKD